MKFHDFANIFNCIRNAEIILKELELIVLKAAHIKGILYHVLQVKSRIEYDSDKFFRMRAGQTLTIDIEDHFQKRDNGVKRGAEFMCHR